VEKSTSGSARAVAVICELNPLHNGHICLFSEIRRRFPDHMIIALMSGSFVQRGAFAVTPKYERAAALIESGCFWETNDPGSLDDSMSAADLVLELPFPFAMGSAEYFASGAVSVLNSLSGEGHEIEYLAFGSECGEAEILHKTAENMLSPEFESALSEAEKNGDESYIKLRERIY